MPFRCLLSVFAFLLLSAGQGYAQDRATLVPVRTMMLTIPNPAPFIGVNSANFRQIAASSDQGQYADSFRDDSVVIWSDAAKTRWRVLIPRPLGMAAELRTSNDQP